MAHGGPPSRSPGAGEPALWGLVRLLAVMAGTGGGFALALAAMFHLHGQRPPPGLDDVVPLAALALGGGVVALFAWNGPLSHLRLDAPGRRPSRADRRRLARQREASAEARRQRLAVLAADPVRARYVALIEAGQAWSDEQIAYDLDAAARTTCLHLRPVEDGLRAAGVWVKLRIPRWVDAQAVCDEPALRRRFALAPEVAYVEGYTSDRGSDWWPYAYLRCGACESRINFLHRDEARHEEPVFPATG
ncbi:hypothetical protein ACO2Q3_02185 [Caulobacter sp. KR2-114]|uniref:hypothetical protein n=1 Tax=Caulobacter sp. KR2-114 TaxID=3400912 RepID=UPI003C11AFF0